MAKPEAGLPERIATLERDIVHLTNDLNALVITRDRVNKLEGRIDERDRKEGLFWTKYGVYATVVGTAAGIVIGALTVLAALGRL
jgi:hypothetical protein